MFSADPSNSENCFQLILGHGFLLTQHAFLLTTRLSSDVYILLSSLNIYSTFQRLTVEMNGGISTYIMFKETFITLKKHEHLIYGVFKILVGIYLLQLTQFLHRPYNFILVYISYPFNR